MNCFLPHILQDENEPFVLSAIGTSIFTESGPSLSFRRTIGVPKNGIVIEYQFFWVYDIQHLYDLEHIWVTVVDEKVTKIEASFHGKFLNASRLAKKHEDGRCILYCQPGKHAFLPDGDLFALLPDANNCCNVQSGEGGLLVMDLFADQLETNKKRNALVCSYIKEHFAFQPTGLWEEMDTFSVPMMSWEELKVHIVQVIKKELQKIEG